MTVVKVNVIECRAGQGPELERRFADYVGLSTGVPGFLGAELLRPDDGADYFSISRWATQQDFDAYAASGPADVRTGDWRGDTAASNRLLGFTVAGSNRD